MKNGTHTDYDIPLLVEQPIKDAAIIAIATAENKPIYFQDLQPFIVTSVTVSTTEYLEIATISGISNKLGKFAVFITGMSMQDKDDKDIVVDHTITVLSGFDCNVKLRFIIDILCTSVSSVITTSPLETFSLVVDKNFPIHLLDCIDDPMKLIEDFVDRYIERIKPDLDDVLKMISDPPQCDLHNQLDVLKIKACMEHDCKDECNTECICKTQQNQIYMSEILDIGNKSIKPISSIIKIESKSISGPQKAEDKNSNSFASLLRPKAETDGDIL